MKFKENSVIKRAKSTIVVLKLIKTAFGKGYL